MRKVHQSHTRGHSHPALLDTRQQSELCYWSKEEICKRWPSSFPDSPFL